MNDVTYVEAARALAERLLAKGGDNDAARSLWLRLCTAPAQ